MIQTSAKVLGDLKTKIHLELKRKQIWNTNEIKTSIDGLISKMVLEELRNSQKD